MLIFQHLTWVRAFLVPEFSFFCRGSGGINPMRFSLGSQTFKLFTLTEPLSMENAMQNLRKLRPRYNSCYWQSSLFPHHLFLCPCIPPPTPLPRPFPKVGLLKPNVTLMSSFLYMFVALKKKRERESIIDWGGAWLPRQLNQLPVLFQCNWTLCPIC